MLKRSTAAGDYLVDYRVANEVNTLWKLCHCHFPNTQTVTSDIYGQLDRSDIGLRSD